MTPPVKAVFTLDQFVLAHEKCLEQFKELQLSGSRWIEFLSRQNQTPIDYDIVTMEEWQDLYKYFLNSSYCESVIV